jgi:hypothetical protein
VAVSSCSIRAERE